MRTILFLVAAMLVTATSADDSTTSLSNKIRWATASEVENFGYDVYRGESEDGPFEKLTQDPIPGAGTTDEPQRYEFVDDTIEPDTAYYYYVESISMSGQRERFTPVYRSRPKSLDGGEASAEAGAEEPVDDSAPGA